MRSFIQVRRLFEKSDYLPLYPYFLLFLENKVFQKMILLKNNSYFYTKKLEI